MPTLDEGFQRLRHRAVKLCKSLSRLRAKDLVSEAFDGQFKQPAILCHCLLSPQEGETDVFGLKNPMTKNDIALSGNLRHFVSDYTRFTSYLYVKVYTIPYDKALTRKNPSA